MSPGTSPRPRPTCSSAGPRLKSSIDNKANQAYFDDLIDDAMMARLSEAADFCSTLGGVYLRVMWDTDVDDKPWVQGLPADTGVPTFRGDKLKAVTFWRILDQQATTSSGTWRHVPREAQGSKDEKPLPTPPKPLAPVGVPPAAPTPAAPAGSAASPQPGR